uniref:Uncharacterized protein n=1 Tax=Glossina pallidipes TaxID=7398 RepID=A0A1B0AJ58_GLOPL
MQVSTCESACRNISFFPSLKEPQRVKQEPELNITYLSQKSDVKIKVFTIISLPYMPEKKVRTSCTSLEKSISILIAGLTEQNRSKPDLLGGPGQRLHGLSRFIESMEIESFHFITISNRYPVIISRLIKFGKVKQICTTHSEFFEIKLMQSKVYVKGVHFKAINDKLNTKRKAFMRRGLDTL